MGVNEKTVDKSFVAFLALASLFVPLFLIYASQSPVVINEIAWAGSVEGWRYEWIELFNNSAAVADISGWQIENALSKNGTLEIASGTIPASGYFLICRKEMPPCDLIETKLSLHNEYNKNGALALKNSSGNTIDTTPPAESAKWLGGDNKTKQTMEWTGNGWQTSPEPGGTPKQQNSQTAEAKSTAPTEQATTTPPSTEQTAEESITTTTAPTPEEPPLSEPQPIDKPAYPLNIFINEILPSPEGPDAENEWVELYNANGFEVDLAEWQIKDKKGALRTYIFPTDTKIVSLGFLALTRPETKITLQNTGDGLELLNPNGELAHSTSYQKAPKAQSYNRTTNGWQWSTILTPEKQNIIPEPRTPSETRSRMAEAPSSQQEGSPPAATGTDADIFSANIEKALPETSSHILTFIFAAIIAVGSAVVVLLIKNQQNKKEI